MEATGPKSCYHFVYLVVGLVCLSFTGIKMHSSIAIIRPLPDDVAAQIKSSTTISSLSDAVLGLIENSLDANARNIDVNIDFGRGSCSVQDDGHGIAPIDFSERGGLGKPYRIATPSTLSY